MERYSGKSLGIVRRICSNLIGRNGSVKEPRSCPARDPQGGGLGGERLAARCGLSQSKISRIERGETLPSVLDVQRILSALDVPQGNRKIDYWI